jgi:hypothetical protein
MKKEAEKIHEEPEMDLTGLADWRIEMFGKLVNDVPAAFPGGPSHKAGSFVYVAPTLVRHPSYNAIGFITPSPTAMALNIAARAAAAAVTVRRQVIFVNGASPVGTVKMVTQETLPYLFDYFENCMIAVTFSFQALEAFSNQIIQARVKGNYTVRRRGETKDLSPDELERELATEEKLATVLPELYNLKTPKGGKLWERFVKLKRVRDSTVHLKQRDAQSELDLDSLYFQFLNYDANDFPRAALDMVEYFQSSKGGPLWMKRIREALKQPIRMNLRNEKRT